jgi:hypothetical protein
LCLGCSGRLANSATCPLSDGVIEYAKKHEEMKGAFLTFQKDADQIYPGWKGELGYTGESSVQAATFDWKKAAAATFLGSLYAKHQKTTSKYWADVGYFSDGMAKNKSANARNHPETIGPDSHEKNTAADMLSRFAQLLVTASCMSP